MTLRCTRCDKKLSRKSARVIEGKTVCAACLFPQLKAGMPAQVGRNAERQDAAERLGPQDEHAVPNGDAPEGQSHD